MPVGKELPHVAVWVLQQVDVGRVVPSHQAVQPTDVFSQSRGHASPSRRRVGKAPAGRSHCPG
jgi:hypothetical protein